ncbi:MAG: hypothetical protein ACI834_000104, partial [Colwellia sp.]
VSGDSAATILGANTHVTDFSTWGEIVTTQVTGSGANAAVFNAWTWYSNK